MGPDVPGAVRRPEYRHVTRPVAVVVARHRHVAGAAPTRPWLSPVGVPDVPRPARRPEHRHVRSAVAVEIAARARHHDGQIAPLLVVVSLVLIASARYRRPCCPRVHPPGPASVVCSPPDSSTVSNKFAHDAPPLSDSCHWNLGPPGCRSPSDRTARPAPEGHSGFAGCVVKTGAVEP